MLILAKQLEFQQWFNCFTQHYFFASTATVFDLMFCKIKFTFLSEFSKLLLGSVFDFFLLQFACNFTLKMYHLKLFFQECIWCCFFIIDCFMYRKYGLYQYKIQVLTKHILMYFGSFLSSL